MELGFSLGLHSAQLTRCMSGNALDAEGLCRALLESGLVLLPPQQQQQQQEQYQRQQQQQQCQWQQQQYRRRLPGALGSPCLSLDNSPLPWPELADVVPAEGDQDPFSLSGCSSPAGNPADYDQEVLW